MSITIGELTVRAVDSNSYDALSTTVGVIVILALLVLLVQREAVVASASEATGARVSALSALILPLIVPWALTITVRLLSLL